MRFTAKGRRILIVTAIVAVAGMAVLASILHRSTWTLRDASGRRICDVTEGMAAPDVATACGTYLRRGTQPKVSQGVSSLVCSAPGDVFGEYVVLYSCDGTVWSVRRLDGYVGVIF